MGLKISVIGTGYVGLVTGACLASLGHKVTCIDKDKSKIDMLLKGEIPIYEPGLQEIVQKSDIKFTTNMEVDDAAAIFLGIGTPTDPKTGNADMTAFFAAANEVAAKLNHKVVIISKSTVPVGTAKKLRAIFGDKAEIVSNPEFLREGSAVQDFMNPDRIVCGTSSEHARDIMSRIYEPLKVPVTFTSTETSELIKYASNAFLAMKVTFINEMADICEAVGADVEELAQGMGSDSRIGPKFLKPGPGVGGSCFPKDARALAVQAREIGKPSAIIDAFIFANENRKLKMAERILKQIPKGTVAVFGLTFKANTDDMRESPSLTIIPELQKAGLKVKAYDPQGMHEAPKFLENIEYCDSAEKCANGADGIVILTEWQEFRDLDYSKLSPKNKLIIDLRNLLYGKELPGYKYSGIGH